MTIGPNNRMDYVGNGATDVYSFNFKIFAASELLVTVRDTDDAETTLAYPADYSVSGVGVAAGGSVTLADGDLTAGYALTIRRVRPLTQTTDIRNQSAVFNDVLEDTVDALVMIDQQQQDEIDRSVKLPETVSAAAVSAMMPVPEGSRLLGWNAAANALENIDASAFASLISFGISGRQTLESDGIETSFALASAPGSKNNTQVYVNGVYQEKDTYSVTGSTLTFDEAPPAGNIEVMTIAVLSVGSTSADLVTYTASGNGAVATDVEEKLRERTSVLDRMTAAQRADVINGTLALDHTAAVQAAIDTGKTVDLLGYSFKVNNLTQSAANQAIVSSIGIGRLIKNANGPILTSSGSDFLMQNVAWRGDASSPTFTGDGVVATGARPAFLNCAGQWISGRALKATGSRVVIKGTCGVYQTTDASSSGYDIEIGASGTATLYHEIDEVYTSQATGGILLIDTGSHTIKGGLFGKLKIDAGTSPAGSNGGKTIGARILGAVDVELSNAAFVGNQFGAVAITFAVDTSGCRLDASNVYAVGATIVNNGSASNFIEREISSGGTTDIKWGPDASSATLTINQGTATEQFQWSGSHVVPNNFAYRTKLNAGTVVSLATVSTSDNATFGSTSFARTDLDGTFINLNSSAGSQAQVVDGAVRPFSDNTKTLGTSSLRWSHAYMVNVRPGAGTATWTSGAGTPEGSVSATVGSLYTRTDGGASTTLYIKESGSGNTGWVAK